MCLVWHCHLLPASTQSVLSSPQTKPPTTNPERSASNVKEVRQLGSGDKVAQPEDAAAAGAGVRLLVVRPRGDGVVRGVVDRPLDEGVVPRAAPPAAVAAGAVAVAGAAALPRRCLFLLLLLLRPAQGVLDVFDQVLELLALRRIDAGDLGPPRVHEPARVAVLDVPKPGLQRRGQRIGAAVV